MPSPAHTQPHSYPVKGTKKEAKFVDVSRCRELQSDIPLKRPAFHRRCGPTRKRAAPFERRSAAIRTISHQEGHSNDPHPRRLPPPLLGHAVRPEAAKAATANSPAWKSRPTGSRFTAGTATGTRATSWCGPPTTISAWATIPVVSRPRAAARRRTAPAPAAPATSPAHRRCTPRWKPNSPHCTARQAALLFGSGYIANQAALSTVLSALPDFHVFSDVKNHASMIAGIPAPRAGVRATSSATTIWPTWKRCCAPHPPTHRS